MPLRRLDTCKMTDTSGLRSGNNREVRVMTEFVSCTSQDPLSWCLPTTANLASNYSAQFLKLFSSGQGHWRNRVFAVKMTSTFNGCGAGVETIFSQSLSCINFKLCN